MNKCFFGDCRDTMRGMISQGVKVQCCVTSPPYYGLRDYGDTGQIGLEKTPEEFVAAMVDVFDIVRDLLLDDGVLWLNIGDSYNAAGRKGHGAGARQGYKQGTNRSSAEKADVCRPNVEALKPKDLIGIPWKVAFALQAHGWYLRQDIIWAKPNPMPESVTDRCTKSHEYLFLLTKNERYYFDQDAIKEKAAGENLHDLTGTGYKAPGQPANTGNRKALRTDIESRRRSQIKGGQSLQAEPDGRRNKRSVWTIPTQPYSGAHFATFPEALVEPCVLAGSRAGDIVLDPFFGSGTTGKVAQRLGRQWIGCELNDEYEPLQRQRTAQCALPL